MMLQPRIISVAPSVALPNWAYRLHGCVKAAVSCCSKGKLPLLVGKPFERIHDENCNRANAGYGGCGWR